MVRDIEKVIEVPVDDEESQVKQNEGSGKVDEATSAKHGPAKQANIASFFKKKWGAYSWLDLNYFVVILCCRLFGNHVKFFINKKG